MPATITFTRRTAADLLAVSVDTVDRLLMQGRLERLAGMRAVRITAPSLAHYTGVCVHEILTTCATDALPAADPNREEAV